MVVSLQTNKKCYQTGLLKFPNWGSYIADKKEDTYARYWRQIIYFGTRDETDLLNLSANVSSREGKSGETGKCLKMNHTFR